MGSSSVLRGWFAATALCALLPLAEPTSAQPAPSAADADRNSPAYAMSGDVHITVRPDLTVEVNRTARFKILRESAIRTLGQQNLSYVESLDPLEVITAFTEKADGRKIEVERANLLTRDAATGLNAIYQRDGKVKTVIFPDIEVGDTLVYVTRSERVDRRYPGQFNYLATFARSTPFETYRVVLDAPKTLELKVSTRGDGLTHETAELEDGQHHTFEYRPTAWSPEEPNAVSMLDRDPQLVVTTFENRKELGVSYWASMKGEDDIAPEILALADDITKGIEARRGQAIAIDRWVKSNIRYVLVFLGSGGLTPNPALKILKNKYGDCKDHVALMGALLRAKGIASEQALINVGAIYQLPDLPVPFFNHVILFLPEFGVYTDPTASHAAFGVLPEGTYDKPVLHISPAGGRPARTPPMNADDHVTAARTIASVGIDGMIKGTTQQTTTGIFATIARSTATQIQAQGREKFAEALLRTLGRPGSGVFEPASPFDYSEPFTVYGDFSLNERLQMPLSGARDIPIGMPIYRRFSAGFFGQRIAGRGTDFICYAGKQVEEIELTFADGLPLPKAMRGGAIDNGYFSYQASYAIKGRKLTILREFNSKVAGQVCAKEMESEITEPLQQVARSLRLQMSF
jgi:transglutaminase-like putative cysteine protease